MKQHLNRRAWPLLIGGLLALAMLARHGGAWRGRERRADKEASDVA
jgi:hypothetical protein